jgi:hypothetical protein
VGLCCFLPSRGSLLTTLHSSFCPCLVFRYGHTCSLSPSELQHLHMAMGPGMGGARRAALAALKQDYEKAFKFGGKV